MSGKRSSRLHVRVTSEQHAEVMRRAALAGLGGSEYIRRRALSEADAPRIESDIATLRLLHANLKRAGGNLNQIARELSTLHRPETISPSIESASLAVQEAARDVSGFIAETLKSI